MPQVTHFEGYVGSTPAYEAVLRRPLQAGILDAALELVNTLSGLG